MDYAATLLAKLPGASRRDHGLRRLLETLEVYLPQEQIEPVMQAYEFGAAAHDGQTRQTGEAYISHPVAVAQELAEMRLDAQAIAAALLHDVVEDTPASISDIEEKFGDEVALIVDGVSKLDQIQFRSRAEAQAETRTFVSFSSSSLIACTTCKPSTQCRRISVRVLRVRRSISMRP